MKKRFISLTPVLLLSLMVLQSCSLFGSSEVGLDYGTYEGIYAYGFETNSFEPCNEQEEQWWVLAGDTDLVERYQELTEGANAIVYARLEGKPSEEGEYGHMDSYSREFEVDEVVEMRYATSNDCN